MAEELATITSQHALEPIVGLSPVVADGRRRSVDQEGTGALQSEESGPGFREFRGSLGDAEKRHKGIKNVLGVLDQRSLALVPLAGFASNGVTEFATGCLIGPSS